MKTYDYINGRSQKIKVGFSFSSELDIFYGVPEGSILGLLLFNIDICDLFFVFCDYAGDTPFYECDQHCGNLISNLELTLDKTFRWFGYNSLKGNPSKSDFSYDLNNIPR